MKKILSGTKEFEFFQDFWSWYQDFYTPEKGKKEDEEKYWNDLIARADVIMRKYDKSHMEQSGEEDISGFVNDLIQAVFKELERRYRK